MNILNAPDAMALDAGLAVPDIIARCNRVNQQQVLDAVSYLHDEGYIFSTVRVEALGFVVKFPFQDKITPVALHCVAPRRRYGDFAQPLLGISNGHPSDRPSSSNLLDELLDQFLVTIATFHGVQARRFAHHRLHRCAVHVALNPTIYRPLLDEQLGHVTPQEMVPRWVKYICGAESVSNTGSNKDRYLIGCPVFPSL